MGISLFVYKQLAFVISSFAGIGGATRMYQTTVQAAAFSAMTYEILLIRGRWRYGFHIRFNIGEFSVYSFQRMVAKVLR